MDIDDYLNLQSHSDGSTQELQDITSPTHENSNNNNNNNNTINSTPTTTTTTFPLVPTSSSTCWNDSLTLDTSEQDDTRLFDKPLPNMDQFLFAFGDNATNTAVNSDGSPNWHLLTQSQQQQQDPSITQMPLNSLSSNNLPDFLAPHFLTLTSTPMTTTCPDTINATMVENNKQQTTLQPATTSIESHPVENEGMVTRSKRLRTDSKSSGDATVVQKQQSSPTPDPPPPARKKRGKKLYCICQQPYDGQPMVQCDECQEWFHCSCVNLDADEIENVDWICDKCKSGNNQKIIWNSLGGNSYVYFFCEAGKYGLVHYIKQHIDHWNAVWVYRLFSILW